MTYIDGIINIYRREINITWCFHGITFHYEVENFLQPITALQSARVMNVCVYKCLQNIVNLAHLFGSCSVY